MRIHIPDADEIADAPHLAALAALEAALVIAARFARAAAPAVPPSDNALTLKWQPP